MRSDDGVIDLTIIHPVAARVVVHHNIRNVKVIQNDREIAPNFFQLRGRSSKTQASLIHMSKIRRTICKSP